jgi:chromate reductase, NAD(P)H dehydrogenase (quinone)
MIKIATINGSSQPDSYTEKALALVHDELNHYKNVKLIRIEPSKLRLPFPGKKMSSSDRGQLKKMVKGAHGVILATPEYHGSFSSLLKLSIENMGFPSALSGKAVSLLGTASGRIGAIKSLEHLRSVCSHVGAIVLPGPISIARVNTVFDEQGNCLDPEIEKQICGLTKNLLRYIRDTACPEISLEQTVRRGTE